MSGKRGESVWMSSVGRVLKRVDEKEERCGSVWISVGGVVR